MVTLKPHRYTPVLGLKPRMLCAYLCIILLLKTPICDASWNLGSLAFDAKLRETVDTVLGHKAFQDVIDKEATFRIQVADGQKTLEILAHDLGKQIFDHNQALINLRDVAEREVETTKPQNLTECCHIKQDLHYNSNFKTLVDVQKQCARVTGTYTRHSGEAFLTQARINTRTLPNLAWQYLGTEEGLLQTYPARNDSCSNYDPRKRPFYAVASSPLAKDIVIMFHYDNVTNLEMTTDSIEVLLNATNDNDRIAMIDVTDAQLAPSYQSDCYSEELAYATPSNYPAFKDFFNHMERHIVRDKGGFYKLAFDKAFRYFSDKSDSSRGKLLLFLTDSNNDGPSTSDDILDLVKKKNERLNNSVVIETYAIGDGVKSETKELLKGLAQSTHFTTSTGYKKPGVFTEFNSSAPNFRHQLGSYYNAFADSGSVKSPQVTVPYVDFSGLGLVISLCLPVHRSNDKFVGVVCIDIKMQDIFLNITHFMGGKNSYTFLIDKNGRTIIHPLIPRPSKVQDHPIFMDITTLEREKGVLNILESMKRGESGSKTLYVTKQSYPFLATSRTPQYQKIQANYFWTKIENSDYSLCLVQTDADSDVELLGVERHRNKYRDLTTLKNQPTCLHHGVRSNKDSSIVNFYESAFKKYLTPTQREAKSPAYIAYFRQDNPSSSSGDDFKTDVHGWTSLSGFVQDFWENTEDKYNSYVYWRYLVLMSGVMRIYPGTDFSINPMTEEWYRQALQETENTVLTPIESDRGLSIMLSRSLRVGRRGEEGMLSEHTELPVGVLAAEFRPGYFYNLMVDLFPDCSKEAARCFIMDYAGYVIVHPNMLTSNEKQHIIKVEPKVAEYLKAPSTQLSWSSCLNFETFQQRLNWQLNNLALIEETSSLKLYKVVHSNIILGIIWTDVGPKLQNEPGLWRCQENLDCECPCESDLKFDYCENKLAEYYSDPISNCPVVSKTHPVLQTQKKVESGIEPCFKTSCQADSFSQCLQLINCNWCYPEELSVTTETCLPTSQCSNVTVTRAAQTTGKNNNKVVIPVIIIIIVILVALLIALIILCKKKPEYFKCLHGILYKQDPKKKKGDDPVNIVVTDSVSTLPRPPAPPPGESGPESNDSLYSTIYDYHGRGIPNRPNTFHGTVPNGSHGSWPQKASTLPESMYLHASRAASDSEVPHSMKSSFVPSMEIQSYTPMEGEGPRINRYTEHFPSKSAKNSFEPPSEGVNNTRWSVSTPPRIPQFKKNESPRPRGLPYLSKRAPLQRDEAISGGPGDSNFAGDPFPSPNIIQDSDSLAEYQNTPTKPKDYSHYNLGFSDSSMEDSYNDRQNARQTGSQFDRPTDSQFDRPTDSQFDRPTDSQFDRPTDSQFDRLTDRQFDKPTDMNDNRTFDRPLQRPSDSQSDRSSDSRFDRPSDSRFDRPTDSQFDRSTDRQFEGLTDRNDNRTFDRPLERPTDGQIDRYVDRPTDMIADRPVYEGDSGYDMDGYDGRGGAGQHYDHPKMSEIPVYNDGMANSAV